MNTTTGAVSGAILDARGRGAALLALLFGAALVLVVGFAEPAAIHNAAHDSRHALAFPCH